MVACEVGVKGIHAAMNGLGERAGNASLSSLIAVFMINSILKRASMKKDK